MARLLGIPATTLRDNINPVLAAFDQLEPVLSDGTTIDDFDDIAWWCAKQGGTAIIDGTELSVARPGDQAEQRPFYSGKRKAHTTKTIAVCDRSSNLLWATPLVGGATHDLTALRDANLPAHLAHWDLDVLADSGFAGPPARRRRRRAAHPPTPPRRDPHRRRAFFNSVLSANRVRLEHAIGRLRQWHCLTVPKQRRDLLERRLPVCWALTSFQQAWPRSCNSAQV